jgi:hypothetical protein
MIPRFSGAVFRRFLGTLVATALIASALATQVPAWLLLSPLGDDSVMTIAEHEKDVLTAAGWKGEGAGAVRDDANPGFALLHRLIRTGPDGVERMLDSDADHVAELLKDGFTEEGLLGFVAAESEEGRIPVVQFSKHEKRLWLVDEASQKAAEENHWRRQGVQFWLLPPPAPAAAK